MNQRKASDSTPESYAKPTSLYPAGDYVVCPAAVASGEDLADLQIDLPPQGAGLGALARHKRLYVESLSEDSGTGTLEPTKLHCIAEVRFRTAAVPLGARLSPEVGRQTGIRKAGAVRLRGLTRRELALDKSGQHPAYVILTSLIVAVATFVAALAGIDKGNPTSAAVLAATAVVALAAAAYVAYRQLRGRLENERDS